MWSFGGLYFAAILVGFCSVSITLPRLTFSSTPFLQQGRLKLSSENQLLLFAHTNEKVGLATCYHALSEITWITL